MGFPEVDGLRQIKCYISSMAPSAGDVYVIIDS